jgi:diaminopropionate ammonia-lyase
VAVADERARQAMCDLAAAGIVAGETGAAALAGLAEATGGPEAGGVRGTPSGSPGRSVGALRRALGLAAASRVLLLCTEGATDPEAYRRIVGGTP